MFFSILQCGELEEGLTAVGLAGSASHWQPVGGGVCGRRGEKHPEGNGRVNEIN